eukprot:gene29375-38924_t
MSRLVDTIDEEELNISIQDIEEQLLVECGGIIEGTDSNDELYSTISELWAVELKNSNNVRKGKIDQKVSEGSLWYKKAYDFWEDPSNCPVSDDGVLQGYGLLTPLDVRDSNIFLDQLHQSFPALGFDCVADCGAGIGRVTKHLLLPRFKHVDLVEQ